jgi:hypothetical protein
MQSGIRKRTLLMIAVLILLVISANVGVGHIASALQFDIRPSNEDLVHRTLMTAAVIYVLLIALPFVPAVEIGLVLIALFGPPVAVLLYVCTILGLTASFVLGWLIPLRVVGTLFAELRLRRASKLIERLDSTDKDARLALLLQNSPRRTVSALLRHRYLVLAVALNLPGNIVIGGGGGIALTAGVSKLYSIAGFLTTIAIAVAPIPLAVLIFGKELVAG